MTAVSPKQTHGARCTFAIADIRCASRELVRCGQGRSRYRGRGACGEFGAVIWRLRFWKLALLSDDWDLSIKRIGGSHGGPKDNAAA